MGGCRCTYKNCSSRSDGVIHMFHYPVFDKVRCHQWLTNAQKLEFLNLKVSQLKNRVVCQHHFKDDNFMNFRKDKLTFDAVPTLDGPYCDSSQLPAKKSIKNQSKLYNITLEDIENEYLSFNDKKANFSVKYGDFLTNGDLMDFDTNNKDDNRQLINYHQFYANNPILYENIHRRKAVEERKTINRSFLNSSFELEQKNNNVFTIQLTEVPVELESNSSITDVSRKPVPSISQTVNQEVTVKPKETIDEKSKSVKRDNKIIILDEQNVSDILPHIPLPIKLEPVCPSDIITLPNKKRNVKYLPKTFNICNKIDDSNIHVDVNNIIVQDSMNTNASKNLGVNNEMIDVNIERNIDQVNIPVSNLSHNINNSNFTNTNDVINTTNVINTGASVINTSDVINSDNINTRCINTRSVTNARTLINRNNSKNLNSVLNTPSVINKNNVDNTNNIVNTKSITSTDKKNNSLIKNKIPPERIAAIQEKRKFNMKLRDIIANCLDKLDANESNYSNSKLQTQQEKQLSQKVNSYLAKEPELPNLQEYAVAYLEARMNKMESILLKKIDNNSQRILDLKNSLVHSIDKRTVSTQTNLTDEEHKKHLYTEISKYLSTDANTLLYEELFIEKYVQKKPKYSPRKRRK